MPPRPQKDTRGGRVMTREGAREPSRPMGHPRQGASRPPPEVSNRFEVLIYGPPGAPGTVSLEIVGAADSEALCGAGGTLALPACALLSPCPSLG